MLSQVVGGRSALFAPVALAATLLASSAAAGEPTRLPLPSGTSSAPSRLPMQSSAAAPQPIDAAATPQLAAAATPVDFTLNDGRLVGVLLDSGGQPLDGVVVEVRRSGQAIGQTTTDTEGRFAFSGLATGQLELATPQGVRPVRIWNEAVAPPSARDLVVLVSQETAVRGQYGLFVDPLPPIALGVGIAGLVVSSVAVGQNNDLEEDLEDAQRELQDALNELTDAVSNSN